MTDTHAFQIDDTEFSVCELHPKHTECLQRLFDQCADFAMLVEGEEVSPHAAQEIFQEVPPGKSLSDKFLYGILDRKGNIVGALEGMRNYPDPTSWWIGLLLLAPNVRGHGLGGKLVRGFSDYVRSQRGASIMLGVVEENQAAHLFWHQLGFDLVRQTEPRRFGKKIQTVRVMRQGLAQEIKERWD